MNSTRAIEDTCANTTQLTSPGSPGSPGSDVASLVRAVVNKASSPVAQAEAFLAACTLHGVVGDQREELYNSIVLQPHISTYVRNTGVTVRGTLYRMSCRQQSLLSATHHIC
jgi:hypothetical protein